MKNNFLEITLSESEKSLIRQGLSTIKYEPDGSNNYITKIRIAAYKHFPSRILKLLEDRKSLKKHTPCIVFNNIPIDDQVYGSPSTSETGIDYKSGCISENTICAFGSIIGEPYSILFEGRELVNNLTPQKESKNDYTGMGSEVELDFHIENSALKFMSEDDCSPMAMFLMGVRSDQKESGPKTYVSDSREALKLLDNETLNILRTNNYIIKLPYRWRGAFNKRKENTDLCPIITGPLKMPRLSAVFYPDMVLAVNDPAKQAFNNLYKAVKSVAYATHITPGKLVYIDNRYMLHSRENFTATYDESGLPYRWVQRLFITSNLWNLRSFKCKGERIFDPTLNS